MRYESGGSRWILTVVFAVALLPAFGVVAQAPDPVEHLTARSTNAEVKLEWENPTVGYSPSATTLICVDNAGYPVDPLTCTEVTNQAPVSGQYDSFSYANSNGTYYFSAFTSVSPDYSARREVQGTPFDTSGPEKWRYATGAASVTAPAIRPGANGIGAIYGNSNDQSLHAMNPSPLGGDWPRSGGYDWLPVPMNGPVQHRPVVLPLAAGNVAFLASLDGYGYCIDIDTGAVIWQTASQLGDALVANPTGFFSEFTSGAPDLMFFGTRNTVAANSLVAINNATGVEDATYTFTNSIAQGGDGTAIGIITGTAAQPSTLRVYFTSREFSGGSSDTIWALDASSSPITKLWSRAIGDIDSAPNAHLNTVYVGNNKGAVYSLDAASLGATNWSYATNDNAIKVGVFRDFTESPVRLYFTTTSRVWSLEDLGASYALVWNSNPALVPSPSMALPMYGGTDVLVADGDGRLLRLSEVDGSVSSSVTLAAPGVTMGSPAIDNVNEMVIVGSTDGIYHAVDISAASPW